MTIYYFKYLKTEDGFHVFRNDERLVSMDVFIPYNLENDVPNKIKLEINSMPPRYGKPWKNPTEIIKIKYIDEPWFLDSLTPKNDKTKKP